MPEHKFLLRIDENIWKRFVLTLPESISANEKIEKLIIDYLIEYEKVMRIDSRIDENKNPEKKQDK